MKVEHPNKYKTIVMQAGTEIIADVETSPTSPGWVEFGNIVGVHSLLIDNSEWDAFVILVEEVDTIKRHGA